MGNGKNPQWSRLDNAAKIFPSTSTSRDSKVFRFACQLREEVEPEILQHALDRTMQQFPFYRCILKKGLFWYYFEDSGQSPVAEAESTPLCAPLYDGDAKNLLFRVMYYQKRISLEVYHALSDGTGALNFLQVLVYYYLTEKHREDFSETPPALDYDASKNQKQDDSFSKYFEKTGKTRQPKAPAAYRLRGPRFPENRIGVIEGTMSVKALLEQAHAYHTTLTVFLTAVMIQAIHEDMSLLDQKKPVVITIPVNLRNYFPSVSARNFFGIINVGYDFRRQENRLEAIIEYVNECFQKWLNKEHLGERMNQLCALEHSLPMKLVPLVFKDPVLRAANWAAEREITAALSNVGRVTMPKELCPYIDSFDVFTATNRLQACMCSFQDRFTISFTSPFLSTDVQRAFFRFMTSLGIAVEVSSSPFQDEIAEENRF